MISAGPSIKHLARFVNGCPFKPDDLGLEGYPVIRIRQLMDPEAEVDYAEPPTRAVWISDGDLVFSWSATLAVQIWDRGPALLNQHLYRVDPLPGVETNWLLYVLEVAVDRLKPLMHGSAMTHITQEMLWSITTALPSVATQRTVADFLDTETARIDALITKKRRLAGLLAEREAGRLRGVMEGLLRIWPAIPAKRLVSESDERLGQHPLPLLSVSIHRGVVPRDELTDKLPRAEELASYKVCHPGDIAINRMRAFQGGVGVVTTTGIVSPDYTVLKLGSRVRSDFLHFTFRSPWFVGEMTRRIRGIGGTGQGNVRTPRVNFSDLGLIRIPIPPIDEQRAIAQRLQADSGAEHRVLERLGRQLCLLEEHRQALITAAVTGELEVPGVAA